VSDREVEGVAVDADLGRSRLKGALAGDLGNGDLEYRSIRDAVGLVLRRDLAQIRMWGRDPIRMLNGLITNDLKKASSSKAVYAAMLTPKGRMLTDLRAILVGEEPAEVLIDLPGTAFRAVGEHLAKYLPPNFARWESGLRDTIGVYGPRSGQVVTALAGVRPEDPEDGVVVFPFRDERVVAISTLVAGGEEGYDLIAPQATAGLLYDELLRRAADAGGGAASPGVLEVLRIEAGRPRYGLDMDDQTLLAEVYEGAGLMDRVVSFTKGCYTGQEVVVRIAHRGHVNRLLRGVLLGDSALPAFRSPVIAGETGKEVGWTTSACYSPRMKQTIALCILRRELSAGDRIFVDRADGAERVTGTVAHLPFEA